MTASPLLFVGHGNPMNAITDNPFRRTWARIAQTLPRPRHILCVSAHWETAAPAVCSADPPVTIHDFGGFPAALYAQQYAAPGAPALAAQVQDLLGPHAVQLTPQWGLDHGAWCVLQSLFPQADVPVCQLSLARSLSPAAHLELARALAPLRQDGCLILCSGNIVHNLRRLGPGAPPDWAVEFDDYVRIALANNDAAALVEFQRAGPCSNLAVPTLEHYLPLLYAVGARMAGDALITFNDAFDLGSLSMRSFVLAPA